MYYFEDNEGNLFRTKFSPKEISECIVFDCFNQSDKKISMAEFKINYKSFEFIEESKNKECYKF